MKVLELFAGSRSIGTECDRRGWECFSVDWQPFEGINLAIDIEQLTREQLPFVPDIVWASPDCATYSIAAISRHRSGTEPRSEYAKKCDRVNQHAFRLIHGLLQENRDLKYFIENPVGMLRKMPFMQGIPKAMITYCKYGDTRMKPTNIWTNHLRSVFNPEGWLPRDMCYNGNLWCHHEASPRGNKTSGTQGMKNDYERSKIPAALVSEILDSCVPKSVPV